MSSHLFALSLAGVAVLASASFLIIRVVQDENSDWTDSIAAKASLIIILLSAILGCLLAWFPPFRFEDILSHLNAKFVSVLGACLGAIGIVGEKRLKRWDNQVRKWLNKRNYNLLWADSSHESVLTSLFKSRIKWLLIGLLVLMIIAMPFSSPYVEELNFGFFIFYGSCMALLSILILVPFGPYLLVPLIWAMLLPYRTIRLIEKEKSLERTLLFIGLVLTIAGIILQE